MQKKDKVRTVNSILKEECYGCGSCENKCPVNAIEMVYDEDGFLYPNILSDLCINCGMCINVCQANEAPILNEEPKAYAVWAQDDIRLKSSSGGMFTLMAHEIVRKGGVIFGAVYSEDYRRVYLAEADSNEEIVEMRGSKYVFAETCHTYKRAESYLKNGRVVLFTGTPCEVAGLKKYLCHEYDNLYTADFICHGGNSIKAYNKWLDEFVNGKKIAKLDFRDKSVFGWSTTATAYLDDGSVVRKNYADCTWYNGFLEGVTIRENCSKCYYAKGNRVADITMGDAWQVSKINSKLNDGKGTSLVTVNTEKGKSFFDKLQESMELCEEIPFEIIRQYNGNLNYPQKLNVGRKFFFSHLDEHGYNRSLWYGRNRRWDSGIVGWWFASNFGSALTYFGLAKIIQKMGKNVIFIPVPMLSGKPWDKETERVEAFIGKHFMIAKKRDINHMQEYNKFCDSFVLGSDQMWTESTTRLVGYSFFLDFVDRNKKKIAVAPSFGAGKFSNNPQMISVAKEYLNRFDSISVREESGIQVCKEIFGIETEQIIDPIFWLDKEEYTRLVDESEAIKEEKYLLCYILDPSQEKKDLIQKIAETKGLKIISILGMREYWTFHDTWDVGKLLQDVSIERFIDYINRSSFFVTDSHHGVCLSIILNKQYLAIGNRQRGIDRFFTIAKLLGLEDRILLDISNYCIPDDINYDLINERVKREAQRGICWLSNAYAKRVDSKKKIVNNLSGGGVHHLEYNNCSNMILKAGKYSDNFGNYIETYSTVEIQICGSDNRVVIGENVKISKIVVGSSNKIEIENNCILQAKQLKLANNAVLKIEDHVFIDGMEIFINEFSILTIGSKTNMQTGKIRTGRNQKICIGRDCMFSWDVVLLGHDGHLLWDTTNGKCINNTDGKLRDSITIGNHVWLGGEVAILPNTEIGSGSICAYRSVVKGKVLNNCLIAGTIAKVVKKNVAWSKENVARNEDRFYALDENYRRKTI